MRRLVAPFLGAVLLLSSAGAVAAQDTALVDPFGCAIFTDGSMTVEPGAPILLRGGWTATTRGQIEAFNRDAIWINTVNGTSIDVRPYLTAPFQIDRKFWAVLWYYPLPPLALGETMHLTTDLVLRHPVYDGSSLYRAGSAYGGPQTCDVAGARNPI